LLLTSDVRYVVRIEGFAAYDPLELTKRDLERDFEAEMRQILKELESLSEGEAADQVHRAFAYDLCPDCWAAYLRDPLEGLRERARERRKKSQGD